MKVKLINKSFPIHLYVFFFPFSLYNISVELNLIVIKSCLPLVEGDPKAPFSIATTPKCRGGRYSNPMIAPLYP